MRGRGKINIPGGMEQDGARFPHATQNHVQFKTYGLFVSGISHLIFFDCDWLQVTDTVEAKARLEGDSCTMYHCSSDVKFGKSGFSPMHSLLLY